MSLQPDLRAAADELSRLLRAAGSPFDAKGVHALVAGVLAAPSPAEPEAWMRLVAPEPGEDLEARLRALHEEMRVTADDGLGAGADRRRLVALREELGRRGLAGFLVPRADEHQNEFVPRRAERLAWLTGFTGSAGLAVVLMDKAAIFVDGRYTLQARAQVDTDAFTLRHLTDEPPEEWLAETLGPGDRLGYDPWLHTLEAMARLRAACERAGAEPVAVEDNPVDRVWTNQPPPPIAPVVPHDLRFAGKDSAEKRREVAEGLETARVDAAVLTAPDSIAWLLNIRGGDVEHTPLPLCFAVLHADGRVDLFIDRRKLVPGLAAHLGEEVSVHAPEAFGAALDRLGREGARVQADGATASAWIFDRLEKSGAKVAKGADPCLLPKACKNDVELAGARAAHRRDGAALTRFLAWLAHEAPAGRLTEIDAAETLAGLRRRNELFRDLSFATISGAGPNGAIVHYRVSETTNRRLAPGELYLVDSGAQYLDGTTDVTRTVFVGGAGPTAEQRDRFTRVLKGHIAIATTRFPEGTTGAQLDAFARRALWEVGIDYDHGTGHGVGSYLGVHEGPQRISKVPNRVALRPGMIVSNEPGYYKTDAYGIRIESLVTVVTTGKVPGGEREMLGFETLTLAPIDLNLIEPSLLTDAEVAWLDAYHARVRAELTPLVDEETATWLEEATRPLAPGREDAR